MQTEEIINELKQLGELSPETIQKIEENRSLRIDLVEYFDKNKNREFALEFLTLLIKLRKNSVIGISGDSLMLACYILGKHNQIEDCLKIWDAKRIDFDTYCYVDIQLLPFAGVKKTIEYLKNQTSEEAKQALEYVIECSEAGDFEDLETYFNKTPWFV
jgi:hypothetical protein